MAYVKIENGVVVQKQPNFQEGFTEAPDNIVCGMIYENGAFSSPPPPPTQVPDSVPALNALLALDGAGLSDAYNEWANDPARTFAEQAFINKAQNWRRDDPTLNAAGDALGLSEEQKDQLFIAADQLLTTA
ncbi:MAG: hypothetical protein CME80_08500 [Halomonas sp.]|nr:hypothetical protein [Halomonas sp.]MBF57744.1 hypothetical protein [Halomonas sp.]|tara:strand:+ start:36770 stop:37162 length:393 start_codon:yes stop_codon:yes gene_type:complete